MIRDTWRAVLVVVTAALLREIALLPRPAVPAATPVVATSWQPPAMPQVAGWPQHNAVAAWQPQWQPPSVATTRQPQQATAQGGPIRKVARATVDLAESVLEAIR